MSCRVSKRDAKWGFEQAGQLSWASFLYNNNNNNYNLEFIVITVTPG